MRNVVRLENNKSHMSKKEKEARRKAVNSFEIRALRKTPPKWLGKEAQTEWRKVIEDVKGYDMFTSSDENMLCMYCIELVAYKQSVTDGYRVDSDKILKQLIVLSDKLGLNPTARGRLAVKKAKTIEKEKEEFDI